MRFFVAFLFLCFFSNLIYAQRISFSENIPQEKVRVILEQLRGGTYSENFDDVQFLQLNPDEVIGKIDNLSIIGNRIGFIDNDSGHFYLYSVSGEFIKKISSIQNYKAKGGKLFSSIGVYGDVFLLGNQDHLFSVDTDGNIKEITQDFLNKGFDYHIMLGNNRFTYFNVFNSEMVNHYALKLGDKSLVQYNKEDSLKFYINRGTSLVKVDENKGFASFNNNYKIFELNPDGIAKYYDFIFPLVNTIEEKVYYEDFKNSYGNYFTKYPEAVVGLGNMASNGDFLVFSIQKGYDPIWVAYNTETNDLFDLSKILPDKKHDYLDILMEEKIFSDGEYLYTIIYPTAFRVAAAKATMENHQLSNKFKELSKINNPILVKFKLK